MKPHYRNPPYRIPYVFGIASLNLENFAGYIGKPHYKPLRNNIMVFLGGDSDIIRSSNLAVNTADSCDSRTPIMPLPTPEQRAASRISATNRSILPPLRRSSTPTGVHKNRSTATNGERIQLTSQMVG